MVPIEPGNGRLLATKDGQQEKAATAATAVAATFSFVLYEPCKAGVMI